MDKTRWLIFGFVCIAAVSWLVFTSRGSGPDVSNVNAAQVQTSGATSDNVFGNKDSKVVVIEYGDFQCPGCASMYPTVKSVKEKYKDQIGFVFRHLPLTSIHPNALAASTAAEAAGEQGKFWEMHDKLYENQTNWQNLSADSRFQAFESYATQINDLDLAAWRQAYESSMSVKEKIAFDRALAKKVGASSTPTFFINDRQLETSEWQNGGLEESIKAALQDAGIALPETTAAEPAPAPAE